ncbi:MAG TPA: C1 family peptidase, partial [Longimicrobium sp.]|nr:C1 family peptidase [Longimicrobium sp.]
PAIRDQQNRGTCTAFASVACLEHHLCRTSGITERLAEQFQYWNMVERTGQHSLVACFPQLKNDGVCRASTWPYWGNEITGNDGQGPPPPAAVAEAAAYRCTDVVQLPARSVPAIQQALRDDHVVAVGFPVYRSWFSSPVVRKYGNITLPFPGEIPERVGHAVALVGFGDDPDFAGGGFFIVRNSWNHVWGTRSLFGSGYGTIPYAYIARLNWDAWCISR